ncbi:MAG: YdcF family protein [Clostridiales bacterium]|nr:YdcF family protein [Clostridiales bacterium]
MLAFLIAAGAALCLLYYLVIVLYAGFTTAFSAVWLLFAVFFGLTAVSIRVYQSNPDQSPLWLPVAMVTLCAAGILIQMALQILIFGQVPSYAEPELDYVIVLGGRVKPDGLSNTLQWRLDKAAEYARENPDTRLILTGAQGEDEPQSEASFMRDYLLAAGVSEERLILEEQARNTAENLKYSKEILDQKMGGADPDYERVGILTSNFHLFRARRIAAKLGMENVQGIASGSDPVLLVHFCVRDGIAILKDRVLGNL